MSSVAQELALTVAEGLLGALDTSRGLETARLLLEDETLDADAARVRLEEMLTPAGCDVCGGDPCTCGALAEEADARADVPNIGVDYNLPPAKKRRRRKRRKGVKVDEATVTGDPPTPGSPSSQTSGTGTNTEWGGVNPAVAAGRAGARGGRRADRDFQPRQGSGQVDAVLTPAESFTEPPALRDAEGWERCGNCVFFGHGLCNLYGWDRPEQGDVVHRGGFPVDRDDLCDSHLTLTPQVQRLVESLDREDERLAEAVRASNAGMVVRARARVRRAEEKLDEALDAQLEETWSDAARAAAMLARRTRYGSQAPPKWKGEGRSRDEAEAHAKVNAAISAPPGLAKGAAVEDAVAHMQNRYAHLGNEARAGRGQTKVPALDSARDRLRKHVLGLSDSDVQKSGLHDRAQWMKREASRLRETWSDASRVAAAASRRAHAGQHTDRFGTQLLDRSKGESALHYAIRRLRDKPEGATVHKDVRTALYGANHPRRGVAVQAAADLPELGLPRYIEQLAEHLRTAKGKERGESYAIAVGVARRVAEGDPSDRRVAEAAAAAAAWDALLEAKDSLAKASTPEPWSTSKTSNWVARVGGLPDYIQHVSHGIKRSNPGLSESEAIQRAIGVVKRWARGGGGVDANTRAAAAKAVAEWEAKKAENAGKRAVKGAARAAKKVSEALALYEATYRPIPPSERFVKALFEEMARAYGRDWMVGMAALDEAELLVARYGEENAEEFGLDEAVLSSLFPHSFGGHWDPLRHPRAAKGRKGGGEFSRTNSVLSKIETKARGGRAAMPGARARQRGYRHPDGAPAHERLAAEMFDHPSADRSIMPGERRALGSYLRRRGDMAFAQHIESGRSRSLSSDEQAHLARTIRGQGVTQTIVSKPSMPTAGGRIGARGMPPTGDRLPSDGGAGKGGSSTAGRAAGTDELFARMRNSSLGAADATDLARGSQHVTKVGISRGAGEVQTYVLARGVKRPELGLSHRHFPEGQFSAEKLRAQITDADREAGRRNEASGQGVDAAITSVLASFPGVKDWNVTKEGEGYHLHVKMDDGEHVIGVDQDGKVEYLSGPQKKAAAKASPMEKAPPGGWTEADKVPPKPKPPKLSEMPAPMPPAGKAIQPDPQWVKDHPALEGTNAQVMAWEHMVELGHHVDVLWTNSGSHYGAHGEVVKKNAKSWRVKISHDVPTAYGGGYQAGHEISVPRGDVFSSAGWSSGNSIRPYGSVKGLPNYDKPLNGGGGGEAEASASAHLAAAQSGELLPSGQYEKPYHMPPGTVYKDTQGELHTHVESGPKLMMGKKGPLAASKVINQKTGATQLVPAFVQKEYEMMLPKGGGGGAGVAGVLKAKYGFDPGPGATSAVEDALKQSVGLGGSGVAGKNVVITGTIPGMTRAEAYAKLVAKGAHPHSSVTKSTHLLITGEGKGTTKKVLDAKKLGVQVIPHHQVQELQEAVKEEMMDDVRRLELVQSQLRQASSSGEIVRLRARRRLLESRLGLEERFVSAEKRRKLAAKGHAMAGGVFPIDSAKDAENAAKLYNSGHHKTPEARAHILRNAKRVGAKVTLN